MYCCGIVSPVKNFFTKAGLSILKIQNPLTKLKTSREVLSVVLVLMEGRDFISLIFR